MKMESSENNSNRLLERLLFILGVLVLIEFFC